MSFKLAMAQIGSEKGDVSANIASHLIAINAASRLGIRYLAFPELSLTGYEPELAKSLAFQLYDTRLEPLVKAAIKNKVTLCVGVPFRTDSLPFIASIIIHHADGQQEYNTKNHLHEGEEIFFEKGFGQKIINIEGIKIAHAICADTNYRNHMLESSNLGAEVYVAGVFISESGYKADIQKFEQNGADCKLLVGIANHMRTTGGGTQSGKVLFGTMGNC